MEIARAKSSRAVRLFSGASLLALAIGAASCDGGGQPGSDQKSAARGAGSDSRPVLVNGQIFISTKDGNNVKIGGVPILVFRQEDITPFVESKLKEAAGGLSKLKDELADVRAQIAKLEPALASANQTHDQARQKARRQNVLIRNLYDTNLVLKPIFDQRAADVSRLSNYIARIVETIGDKQKRYETDAKSDPDAGLRKLLRQSMLQEVAELDRQKAAARTELESILPEFQEAERHRNEQKVEMDRLQKELVGLEADATRTAAAVREAEDALYGPEHRAQELADAIDAFNPAPVLFKELPTPFSRVVSDADGRFQLRLPDPGRFVVYAHADRTAFDEHFDWFIRVEAKPGSPGTLILSNGNTFGKTSPDQVVTQHAVE